MMEGIQGNQLPVINGWFTDGNGEASLIGNKCNSCGDYFFPKAHSCRNPKCSNDDLEEVFLSQRGVLWSCTNNHYPPPAPFVASEPFVPYSIVVVELEKEKLMVLGQLAEGYDFEKLQVGMEMELVVEPLYVENSVEHTIWKWKPVESSNTNG